MPSNRKRNREADLHLSRFHSNFDQLNRSGKLDLLRQMAGIRLNNQQCYAERKEQFEQWKQRFKLPGPCRVCGDSATVRHHIIQIQNGGPNRKSNIIRLCDDCHAEVHPWLTNYAEQKNLDDRLIFLFSQQD